MIALALVSQLVGCTAWTASNTPIESLEGRRVRVTTDEGIRFEGRVVQEDTSGATVLLRVRESSSPLVLDTSTIQSIELRKIHEGRTAGLALLGLGAVAFTIIQIKRIFNDPDY